MMMMPGVEIARKRRIHHRHEIAADGTSNSSMAGRTSSLRPSTPTAMGEPAILARLRLDEKLQGLAIGHRRNPPSSSYSSSSGLPLLPSTPPPAISHRQNRHVEGGGNTRLGASITEANSGATSRSNTMPRVATATEIIPQAPNRVSSMPRSTSVRSLRRSNSRVDVCAVCLEEVDASTQRIMWLPCSHKYHSDCVLPWLAAHSHCPCCRTEVPPLHVLAQ